MLRPVRGATAAAALALLGLLAGCATAAHPARTGVSVQLDAVGVSAATADDPDPTRVDFDQGGAAVLAYLTAYLGDPEPIVDPGCAPAPRFAWPAAGIQLRLPPVGDDGPPLVIAEAVGEPGSDPWVFAVPEGTAPVVTAPGGVLLGAPVSAPDPYDIIGDAARNTRERLPGFRQEHDDGGFSIVLDHVDGTALGRPFGVVGDVDADSRLVRLRTPSSVAGPAC